MKRLLIVLILFSTFSYSQDFEIHRAITNGVQGKVKGTVSITDSIITLTFKKSSTQTYRVIKSKSIDGYPVYKSNPDKTEGDIEFRFSLVESNVYAKAPYLLSIDSFDRFTGQTINVVYALKKTD